MRLLLSILLFLGLIFTGYLLSRSETFGRETAFAWTAGAVFGLALQRSRFCFFCNLRDFVDRREAGGVLAILFSLAVGLVGYHVVTGAWIVDPFAGHLPPKAHISPVGWNLILGGFVFGLGMAISGSCISAHLYRLGEGAVVCGFALAGLIPGFVLGFATWNPVYLTLVSGRKAVWLPAYGGFFVALVGQLLVLGAFAFGVWKFSRRNEAVSVVLEKSLAEIARAVFVRRWPGWVGGLVIGLLSAVVVLRLEPLGVTSEFSRLARWIGDTLGLLPDRLEGLDVIRGCSARVSDGLISRSGFFLIALVGASLAAALAAGEFALEWPKRNAALAAVAGGVLLGLGATWSFGCTIGTLLSGIHASALSGWIFFPSLLAGVLSGLPLRRRIVR